MSTTTTGGADSATSTVAAGEDYAGPRLKQRYRSEIVPALREAVGVAQAALDSAVEYARHRRQFGRRIADFQGLSFLLADMATQVEAARALYLSAARLRDAGRPYGPQAAMSKLFATDTAMRVTTDAVQVLGGYGYVEDFPVERYLREAKVLQIVEGTNQIQRVVIGRALTGS